MLNRCRGYLWTTLIPLLFASGCAWRGTPKTPVAPDYSACMKSCDPGGACIPKGNGWECLPPAVEVVPPAEAGE
jgi:hypothetical protein